MADRYTILNLLKQNIMIAASSAPARPRDTDHVPATVQPARPCDTDHVLVVAQPARPRDTDCMSATTAGSNAESAAKITCRRLSYRQATAGKGEFMKILEVSHLTKVYGKGETAVRALDDVSFSVDKGEFVAITGPSGSGKSTLLHILGGVDTPTGGNVVIEGTDIYQLNETNLAIFRRRQIGLIYQFYNLIPVLDVWENMTLPLLLDAQKTDKAYTKELIRTLGLEKRMHHLPNQLSGGQQQRVSIGRALITHPALVLADEPTGNLDRKNGSEIVELLKYSNRKYNQTLIVITHDESIALQADRIVNIEDGKITRDEVLRQAAHKEYVPEVGV